MLGQQAVAEKCNEIEAIPLLLQRLDLPGALVTIDAIGCQDKIDEIVLAKSGDYLLALKANRPATFAGVELFFRDRSVVLIDTATTTDADHGRLEVRRKVICHDLAWLVPKHRHPGEITFPGLAMIGTVDAEVERDGKTTTSRRCYLSSANPDYSRGGRAWASGRFSSRDPHRRRSTHVEAQ